MKHRVKSKKFNRDTKSRKALLMNLLRSLVEHGQIKTSEARAKEVSRLMDKLISTAKKGDLSARRQLHRVFGKRDVVNTLVDKVAPAMAERNSGFSSIKKLTARRGDNMDVFQVSLLVKEKNWNSLNNDERVAKKVAAKVENKQAKVSKKKSSSPKKLEKKAETTAVSMAQLAKEEQKKRGAKSSSVNLRSFTRRKSGDK